MFFPGALQHLVSLPPLPLTRPSQDSASGSKAYFQWSARFFYALGYQGLWAAHGLALFNLLSPESSYNRQHPSAIRDETLDALGPLGMPAYIGGLSVVSYNMISLIVYGVPLAMKKGWEHLPWFFLLPKLFIQGAALAAAVGTMTSLDRAEPLASRLEDFEDWVKILERKDPKNEDYNLVRFFVDSTSHCHWLIALTMIDCLLFNYLVYRDLREQVTRE